MVKKWSCNIYSQGSFSTLKRISPQTLKSGFRMPDPVITPDWTLAGFILMYSSSHLQPNSKAYEFVMLFFFMAVWQFSGTIGTWESHRTIRIRSTACDFHPFTVYPVFKDGLPRKCAAGQVRISPDFCKSDGWWFYRWVGVWPTNPCRTLFNRK